MRLFRFVIFLVLTLSLIYFLDNRWVIGKTAIPPLGKFLDPFHGFWQNIEANDYAAPDEIDLQGLKAKVTIAYDSIMVPHIFAANDEDLAMAQGFVTAYHRLWQMEFQTHAAAGRISELIGAVALDYDRKQRRLGMVYGAENFAQEIMKHREMARLLEKYAEGVNAYIERLDYKDLPFEYKLLDYRPEEWTVLKTGLLLKNLSQTLNIGEADLEMTNVLATFGKDVVDLLYTESDHPIDDPIVDNPGGWNFPPVSLDSVPLALPSELVSVKRPAEKKRGVGSNNWAVHGSRTVSGAPIFCNDPHLTLSHPSIWYVVHLHAPGINAMGGSLPGAPLVVLGFNDSTAWGCTNAQRDLVDWYSIRFRDGSREEYMSDGAWKKTRKKVEQFNVRDGEIFIDTVIYTHHGPVVYDRNFQSGNGKNNYAMRWIAHDASLELVTLNLLNRGRNYDDYRKALTYWSGPAQNFAFASVQNDIAITVQGKFPVRRQDEGRFLLDGTKTSTEWQKYIPFGQNATIRNPARGFVSSANQYPADATYPYYIQSDSYESFRNRRINAVLSKSENVSPQDMMNLQNDNFNLRAAESLPLMLSLLDVSSLKGEESRIAESLTFWNFVNSRESVAASYYDRWWDLLMAKAWDEMINQDVSFSVPENYSMIRLMKSHPDLEFWDVKATPEKETLADIVRSSFSDAVKSVGEWEATEGKSAKWADFKDTYIQHLLRLEPLSTHARVGGDEGIVNAAGPRQAPSWRFVVSLEKPQVKAWGVYPAGQSGNPGSRFYDNMVGYWSEGKYFPLVFAPTLEQVEAKSIFTTTLTPED